MKTRRAQGLTAIDWSRLACPQEDGYDTQAILFLAATVQAPGRKELFVRRRPPQDVMTLCDGRVAVYAPQTTLNLEILQLTDTLLRFWPEVREQCGQMIDTLEALPLVRDDASSFPDRERFGSMSAVIGRPWVLARSIVSGMAHQKLRALGVASSSSNRLVISSETPPLAPRRTKVYPLPAIVHDLYVEAHLLQLDLLWLPQHDHRSVCRRIAKGSRNLHEDLLWLRNQLQVDIPGSAFFKGFYAWMGRLLSQATAAVAGVDIRTGERVA